MHVDKRALPGVLEVCDAWEIFPNFRDVDEIYSRHMLEHLTSMEADRALRNWYRALKVGGQVHIVVPNLDFHCQQWLKADWNEDTIHNKWSDARYSSAGLYGWQRRCDPKASDYTQSYWDVHKSGYNERKLRFLLERIGFDRVSINVVDDVHLDATAEKTMDPGERQIAPSLDGIRVDHKERYEFAKNRIPENSTILDAACGVGYGSFILGTSNACSVVGVDKSIEAIDYANRNYKTPNVSFQCVDLKSLAFDDHSFDFIVSFETYEHIDFTKSFIKRCKALLKENGKIIISTPNQANLPFDPSRFRFHQRHYLLSEMETELRECGFVLEEVYCQDYYAPTTSRGMIRIGDNGEFLVLVAKSHTPSPKLAI